MWSNKNRMKPKIKRDLDRVQKQSLKQQHFNPSDIAKRLTRIHKYDVGLFFSSVSKLSHTHLGEVMIALPNDILPLLIKRLSPTRITAIIEALESDEATDLIQKITLHDTYLTKKVLTSIKPQDRQEIAKLSQYSDEQAGAYMECEFLSATTQQSIADVKELVKEFRVNEPSSPIIKLFVTDTKQILVGSLHFSQLILYEDETKIGDILLQEVSHHTPLTIRPISPIAEVVRLFEEYDLNIVAVVNKSGKLIGRIVYDDIYDMIRHIETEQVYALAGVDDEAEESGSLQASKQRLIWLVVNLGTILLASFVIDQFSQIILSYVALAALLPIVAALGGNAGMQALTVTIRKMALGEIEYSDLSKTLQREASIVLFNGFSIALIASGVVYVWFGDSMLSLIVASALLLNIIVAGLAGTLIPLGLQKLNIDPAVASSIFLTTTVDIFGFFIFLFLADLFLL